MAKLKIEDLKKIKENIKGTINLREGKYRARITVHMGTCGISAGARTVMEVLLEEIAKVGVTDVQVTSSGCAGLCSHEPMATVEVKGSAPVKYVKLDKEKTAEVFTKHVLNGDIVSEYALVQGSERLHS